MYYGTQYNTPSATWVSE